MIISLALSFIAIASGTLLTYTYDEDAPLASRLCSGACIGFGSSGLIGFILASFLGMTMVTLALTGAALATPFLLLINKGRRASDDDDCNRSWGAIRGARARPARWAGIYVLFYATVAIVMLLGFAPAHLCKPDRVATGLL